MKQLTLLSKKLCFLSSADFFFKINSFFQNVLSGLPSERRTVWVQSRPDVMLGLNNIGSDLGPNCLQMLSADITSRQNSSGSTGSVGGSFEPLPAPRFLISYENEMIWSQ